MALRSSYSNLYGSKQLPRMAKGKKKRKKKLATRRVVKGKR